jgi:tRNA A-37 threonylcarbamoyl transferase component Bud32
MNTRTQRSIIKNERWLLGLRVLWLLLFGFAFFAVLLATIQRSQNLNIATTPELGNFLSELGLPVNFSRVYFFIWEVLTLLVVCLVSFFVFLRRSDDWVALLVSLSSFYLVIMLSQNIYYYSELLGMLIAFIGTPLFVLTAFLFPTGAFIPKFSRWLVLPLSILVWLVVPNLARDRATVGTLADALLGAGAGLFALTVGILCQVYRYLRFANPLQKQQTKWVVFAFTLWLSIQLVYFVLPLLIPSLRWAITYPEIGHYSLSSFSWVMVIGAVTTVSISFFPLALVFSIMRYRLWDIDLVINRSLVGVVVTIFLLLIFVPSVFLIQSLLGADNTLLSYLVSAAIPALLFQPVHKRVRHFVDRQVYGFNFDMNQLRAAQQKPEIRNAGALTGKKLGQYEVLDFIGKGGMGEVYKGYADGKTVAIKTMLEQYSKEEAYMKRFQREAEVMQSLQHPKIVKLHGVGESDGLHYLVMDFIEGKELKAYLRDKGKVSLDDAKAILCDIAAALDYLHEKDIVHRDIKPSNVMLRGDDPTEAILMDFGIAKIEDGKTRLTGSGAIGTIDYMSPEQIITAKTVDKRADVYALGVVAYEMLTGERPFEGNAAQVMFAHLQKPVTDPRQHRSDLPEAISLALMKALEKQPEDRFESAGAFVGAML